jgi:proline dehydrogenase
LNPLGRGLLAITDRSAVRRLFTETDAGRRLSHRFVAGETLAEGAAVARELNDQGFRVSLDHLGEHVDSYEACFDARDAYLACLDRIGADGLDANISVKLTHLGLAVDPELVVDSLTKLAARAAEVGTTVTVDMEESDYTEATVTAYEAVQPEAGNLGIAVQSYLYRTERDLDRIIPLGGHVRLCKGAYAEPETVAHQSKAAVDAAFDRHCKRLMGEPGVVTAIATHDGARIANAERLGATRTEPWEFQMLYGVRRDLQADLVAAGHPVRIYLPYGAAWYPYLTRRMAERPSNLAFFLRAAAGK